MIKEPPQSIEIELNNIKFSKELNKIKRDFLHLDARGFSIESECIYIINMYKISRHETLPQWYSFHMRLYQFEAGVKYIQICSDLFTSHRQRHVKTIM